MVKQRPNSVGNRRFICRIPANGRAMADRRSQKILDAVEISDGMRAELEAIALRHPVAIGSLGMMGGLLAADSGTPASPRPSQRR
jgi:hypothetical protein